jgi:hypothetical protein
MIVFSQNGVFPILENSFYNFHTEKGNTSNNLVGRRKNVGKKRKNVILHGLNVYPSPVGATHQ